MMSVLFISSGTIFWDNISGQYFGTVFWDNILGPILGMIISKVTNPKIFFLSKRSRNRFYSRKYENSIFLRNLMELELEKPIYLCQIRPLEIGKYPDFIRSNKHTYFLPTHRMSISTCRNLNLAFVFLASVVNFRH